MAKKQLGPYVIERKLGEGGMGDVFLGFDSENERMVAVKTIRGELVDHPKKLQRFQREIDLQRKVKHPNVVQILDRGEHNGMQYIVLEYVEGQELADVIPAGGMDPSQAAHITERVCRAMFDVHELGIIHRDMKPANVLMDGVGNPHIIDFGVAKSLSGDEDVKLTRDGGFVGTLEYASPEQAEGRLGEVDHRSDIFNLGAMLYKLLTGRTPFFDPKKTDPTELRMRIVRDHPIEPRRLRPEIPQDLENIVLQALAKDMSKRYQTALEMAEDLARFLAGERVRVQYSLKADKLAQWVAKRRWAIVGVTIFIFSLCASAAFYANKLQRDRQVLRATADQRIRELKVDDANKVAARVDAYSVTLNFPGHKGAIDVLNKVVPKRDDAPALIAQAKARLAAGDRNGASELISLAYIKQPSKVAEMGFFFFDGLWLSKNDARRLGVIDPRLERRPGKFTFAGKWISEEEAIKNGFLVKDLKTDRYINGEDARARGWLFPDAETGWIRPEVAIKAGMVFYHRETDSYLKPGAAEKLGYNFAGDRWLGPEESEKAGRGMRLEERWLNAEEAYFAGYRHHFESGTWYHISEVWKSSTPGLKLMAPERVTTVAWARKASQLALGTFSGKLLLYDKGSLTTPIASVQMGRGGTRKLPITHLGYDHKDRGLVAIDQGGTACVYVTESKRFTLKRVKEGIAANVVAARVAMLEDTKVAFELAMRQAGKLRIEQHPTNLNARREIEVGERFAQAAWTHDGRHLLIATPTQLRHYDIPNATLVTSVKASGIDDPALRVAFAPRGVIALGLKRELRLLDGRDGTLLKTHKVAGEISGLCFDANSELLLVTYTTDSDDVTKQPQGVLFSAGRRR